MADRCIRCNLWGVERLDGARVADEAGQPVVVVVIACPRCGPRTLVTADVGPATKRYVVRIPVSPHLGGDDDVAK